jgi:hypothetical protein
MEEQSLGKDRVQNFGYPEEEDDEDFLKEFFDDEA